jgi:AbrB family looped-hinge helix DNA binding protein
MKEILVPIDKAGRLVLPKHLREELAIQAGDLLKVGIRGDELTLQPKREKTGFVRKGSALVFSTGGADLLTSGTVETILAEEREARGSFTTAALPKRQRQK